MAPYRSRNLLITRDQALELQEDGYYIGDLIGLEVIMEDGTKLGTVRDVLQTGANDVYIVDTVNDKELLIPATHECVMEINPEEGFMKVHLLEGLLDL